MNSYAHRSILKFESVKNCPKILNGAYFKFCRNKYQYSENTMCMNLIYTYKKNSISRNRQIVQKKVKLFIYYFTKKIVPNSFTSSSENKNSKIQSSICLEIIPVEPDHYNLLMHIENFWKIVNDTSLKVFQCWQT